MAEHHHLTEDEKVLHSMGYAQELSRRMGTFQSFAISFSIICIISGGLASFPIAMSTVGPWTATICWILGGVYALIVAASLGQIASAYPTAGSLYHWSSILGGKFWGWLTAYTNLLGLLFVIPAVNVILYTFIRDLFFSGMLGWDVSTWTNTTMFIWIAGITIAQCLLNHFGIRLTTILTDFSGYLIFVVTIVLVILLFMHVPSWDFGHAFTFVNKTGAAGGGVAPETGIFIAVLMGFLYPLFTITGFDASAHTSEETIDAQNTVHKGMLTSVFWSLVFGFVLALGMVMALPAVYTTLAADPNQTMVSKEIMDQLAAIPGGPTPADMAILGWSSFAVLFNTLIMPSFLGKICAIGIILANFFCALSGLTSTSRMIYAFARDRGLPHQLATSARPTARRRRRSGSPASSPSCWWWSPRRSTPSRPCRRAAPCISTCPTACRWSPACFAEGKTWTTYGKFRLGGLSKLFAIIVAIGTIGIIIGGHAFVPSITGDTFVPGLIYYTVAFYGLLVIAWFAFEGRRFKGPPMGEEIARRQAEIAKAEARARGR